MNLNFLKMLSDKSSALMRSRRTGGQGPTTH